MDLYELAQLGTEMRTAQQAYFRYKTKEALREAKLLEKQFDQVCQEVMQGQHGLFDDDMPYLGPRRGE